MRLISLLTIFFMQGCVIQVGDHTPRVHTSVSSLSLPNGHNLQRYILLPSIPGVSQTDLQFREYSKYVHRLLKIKGYELVEKDELPEIVIFLGYGIGEPEESYNTYQMPVIGTAPTGVSSLSGTITPNALGTQIDATVVEHKGLAVTGYTTHVNRTVNYSRHLELYAVDVSAYSVTEEVTPVWQTTITSRGNSGDLRYVFPYLVAAANQFVANDSGTSVDVTIRQDNHLKKYIEGLESIPPN